MSWFSRYRVISQDIDYFLELEPEAPALPVLTRVPIAVADKAGFPMRVNSGAWVTVEFFDSSTLWPLVVHVELLAA